MNKGLLIYHQKDAERNRFFIQELLNAAKKLDLQLTFATTNQLTWGIKNGQPFLLYQGMNVADIDFAIVRAVQPFLSKHLEHMDIRCFNSARVAEICNDKAKTHLFLSSLNIPMADSLFFQGGDIPALPNDFTFPLVLKEVDGRGGKEVYLIHSLDEIRNHVHMIKSYILQKMIQPGGRDARIFVMGNEIIGAVLRQSNDSFKANYSLGGTATAYTLTDQQIAVVKKIINELQPDFIGIDFLVDDKGNFYLNEIEDVVGSRTLYETANINVAFEYMAYIEKKIRRKT